MLTVTRNKMQLIESIYKDTQVAAKEMYPTPISDDVALTPDALLKVIKCGCSAEMQCRHSNLTCSMFCACQGGHICFNDMTRQTLQADDVDYDDN